MKVDNLIGLELDYYLAISQGLDVYGPKDGDKFVVYFDGCDKQFQADFNYCMGIVVKEKYYSIGKNLDGTHGCGIMTDYNRFFSSDKDLLTALKRCIIKSKYGETVNEN